MALCSQMALQYAATIDRRRAQRGVVNSELEDERMEQLYQKNGIRFRYPADWELSEQAGPGEASITVSSPNTAFWTLNLYFERPAPRRLVETALNAFREEYDELDIYDASATICNQTTIAKDLEFVCMELLNSAWLRVCRTPFFSVVLLYQANDADLPDTRATMEAMTSSLACDDAVLGAIQADDDIEDDDFEDGEDDIADDDTN